jgi:hypothetical protein
MRTLPFVRPELPIPRLPRVLVAIAAMVLGCLALVGGTLAAPTSENMRELNCGNVVGPRWVAKYGPTTGRHYTVTATNVSCATAISHFRRIVGRISPGAGSDGFWHPLPDVSCFAPPKGKPYVIGGCTLGSRPALPMPGGGGGGKVRSFRWHLCIATAKKNLECTFTYLK